MKNDSNVKKIERMLYEYESYKAGIINLELDYDGGLSGISYDGVKSGTTNKITSMTEIEAIEKADSRNEFKWMADRIKAIDTALDHLSETERTIIEMKYFKCYHWYQIAHVVNMSESSCRRTVRHALRKLVISIPFKSNMNRK